MFDTYDFSYSAVCKTAFSVALVTILAACGGGGGGGSNSDNGSSSSTSSSGSSSSSSSGVATRTPDWVVFRADKQVDERFDIYATLDDGSIDPIMLSDTDIPVSCFSFYVSPDGEYVAFLAREDADMDGDFDFNDGPAELYRAPVDGSSNAVKISGSINDYTGIGQISWSPTSTMLAYRADVDTDEVREIYLVKNAETGPTKVNGDTAGVVEMGDIHWSPNGRYLAQFVLNKNRSYILDRQAINVFDTTLETPNSTRITGGLLPGSSYDSVSGWSGANISHMYWAPDSSRIVYMLDDHRDDNQRRYYQALPSGNNENVTGPLAADENGGLLYSWSPDSRYLAYVVVSDGVGNTSIEIYDSVEMDYHRVVTAPDGETLQNFLHWRPGANQFVVGIPGTSLESAWDLYLLNVANTQDEDILPLVSGTPGGFSAISWSGDGDRLAFQSYSELNGRWALMSIAPGESAVQVSPFIDGHFEGYDYAWFPSQNQLLYHTDEAFYVAPANESDASQKVNADLDINVQAGSLGTSIVGTVPTSAESAIPNRVAFLAVNPETSAASLYTNLSDGSDLQEIAGDLVANGNVVQFRFAKPSGQEGE